MFGALGLFFSGAFNRLLKLLSAVLEWLLSDWRNGPLTIFALAFAVHTFIEKPRLRSDVAAMTAQRDSAIEERTATMDAFEQTVASYLAAADQAQRDAEANVARVEADQAEITQEITDDYESRIGAVRAYADRLRAAAVRAAPIDPGSASAVGLPGSGSASTGADGAPANPQLPARSGACPAALVCLTIDQALKATEQAIQLDALIDWNERQLNVQFNNPEL